MRRFAAMDFFTVLTATFRVLYCFFVISHSGRRILDFNATEIPPISASSSNCGEVVPEDRAPKYPALNRDGKFSRDVARIWKLS